MQHRGIFWMIIASFFFAMMGLCVKFATVTATPAQAIFFRALSGFPILGWIIYQKKIPIFSSERKGLLFIRSFFGFTGLTLYFYSLAFIPLGNAAILNATAPIFVVFFSNKFLQEKVRKLVYLAIPFFLLGVVLIVKPARADDGFHHLMALLSGISGSLAYVSVRKLGKTEHATTIVFYFTAVSLIGSLPLLYFDWKILTLQNVIPLIGSGVFATFAQLAMTKAYKLERASIVSLYGYLAPVFAYLFGLLFLSEVPDLWAVLGALLILVCAVWIYQTNKT